MLTYSPKHPWLRLFLPQVLLWDVSQEGAVIRYPVRAVLMPIHRRYPPEMLLLSVSFNSDGSRLAVTSKDRRIRVLDPRTGKILQVCFWSVCVASWKQKTNIVIMILMFLQVSSSESHRASKVLYTGGLNMLLSTGSSPWNHRQIVLWDPVRHTHTSEWLISCCGYLIHWLNTHLPQLLLNIQGIFQ